MSNKLDDALTDFVRVLTQLAKLAIKAVEKELAE